MPKILKEEILKAEDKPFFQYVLDHQCVPNVVEVEEEEGDGGWQDGGIAQRGCITHGGWKSVSSLQHPRWRARPLCLRSQSLPEMQRRAHKVHGSEQRRTLCSRIISRWSSASGSENTESSQQRPLQLKTRFIIRRRQRAILAQGELLAVRIGDPASDDWPLAIAEYRAVAAEQASDVLQDEVYGPYE